MYVCTYFFILGLHKIKKEKTGDVEGDKSGVAVSPTSEDSSSGNMSSNDDDEDCAAHTCLRPTGNFIRRLFCSRFLFVYLLNSFDLYNR